MSEVDKKKETIYLAGVERDDEERCYMRYGGDLPCELKIGQKAYEGIVFDFSDGVGVVLKKEGLPEFEKGTQTYIKIPDLDVEFSAETAWTMDSDGHVKVGLRRIENFKGNLKYYRLPDVLTGISRSKKTGVLEITSGSTIKRIIVEKGDKIFAASNNEDDRLGEYLLKKGTITIEEFEQASYLIAKNGDRLGKVLIDLAYLTPSELFQAVQDQIEEIILSLFSLEEGTFEFKEGPLPTNEVIKLKISSANLIFKGIKKIENFVQVKKMCPSPETVLNISQIPVDIFKSLTLDDEDKKILSYVNGVHPLKTILSLSPSSNYETLKTISALLSIGFIHVKDEDEEPAKLSIEKIFSEPGDEVPEELKAGNSEAEPVMEEADCSGCSDCSCSTGSHDEEEVVINTADVEVASDLVAESAGLPNEINGVQEWSKEEKEMSVADVADISEAEAVMEESIVEKELEKPEPWEESAEMAFAADGGSSIIHESIEPDREETVSSYDMDNDAFEYQDGTDRHLSTFPETQSAIEKEELNGEVSQYNEPPEQGPKIEMEAEETAIDIMAIQEEGASLKDKPEVDAKSEDIEPETVPMIVDNDSASEAGLSRRNRFYISIAFLLIVITGAGLSLVYDDMKSVISSPVKQLEVSGTLEEAQPVSPAVPIHSVSDKVKEAESKTPFPSFREDILGKLLSE